MTETTITKETITIDPAWSEDAEKYRNAGAPNTADALEGVISCLPTDSPLGIHYPSFTVTTEQRDQLLSALNMTCDSQGEGIPNVTPAFATEGHINLWNGEVHWSQSGIILCMSAYSESVVLANLVEHFATWVKRDDGSQSCRLTLEGLIAKPIWDWVAAQEAGVDVSVVA